ncbi:hypothetical protein [Kamptonema formosum]|uniref:hypothetical protein n=1 Tax=Kamptonema formosum TaxID=331992 RepID=UPI000344E47A|nr:hypothetical protein [Oscillatoria sp. PCC 10802]
MNYLKKVWQTKAGLVGAICGSLLVAIPAIPLAGFAHQLARTIPLPEQQNSPLARIEPVAGQLDIKLRNDTGDPIIYQVIGDTKPRTLPGHSQVTLLDLKAPVNLTFQRPRGGLLQAQPYVARPGVLQVTFNQTTDLGADKNVLSVEKNGSVFVY